MAWVWHGAGCMAQGMARGRMHGTMLGRVKAQGTALKDTMQLPQLQEELLLTVLALLVKIVLLKSNAIAGAAARDIDVP